MGGEDGELGVNQINGTGVRGGGSLKKPLKNGGDSMGRHEFKRVGKGGRIRK